jgi:hypothetical protein
VLEWVLNYGAHNGTPHPLHSVQQPISWPIW